MKLKELWKGEYLSVVSPEEYAYETIHERDSVLIIPIISYNSDIKIGIRKELCPAYLIKDSTDEKLYYSIISGTVDNESPQETVERELKEEAGISFKNNKYFLFAINKSLPICKSTDLRIQKIAFISVSSDDIIIELPKGDGTIYESKSRTEFVTFKEMRDIIKKKSNYDMFFLLSYYILLNLNEKNVIQL